jgi:vitamin B12 transporter
MRTALTGLLVIGVLVIETGHAQLDPPVTRDVDQIIVTGSRVPLAADRLGSATTIIGREEIEARQARYVTDLLRSVPGFSVSQAGAIGSQTQVRVRGAEANHLLVLLDGVRVNDPATGDEFRWEYLSSNDIERIEIVRGAQSALWGSDAVAGVVQIVTRDADGAASLGGFAETGTDDARNVGLDGSLGLHDWSLHGSIEQLETSGNNISRLGTEKDGSDLRTATLAARWRRAETFSLEAGVRAIDATSQFDPVDFLVTGLPVDGDVATESASISGRIGANWDFSDMTHHIDASYYESKHENLTEQIVDSTAASDRLALSWQSDLKLGENVLSLALGHERTTYGQRGEIVFGDPNQDQRMDATSATAEFQWLAGDRLTWIVGARLERNSDFEDVATGHVALALRLSSKARFRSSLGTAQKNPTFTERFGYFPDQFIGNPSLEPERSLSFDAGVDFDLLDRALQLQTTLFWQDLRDEINGFVFDPATFLATAVNRPGRSERRGAEIALQWRVGDRLGLGANYTYTKASEQDEIGHAITELRRPRHAGGVSIDYDPDGRRTRALLTADYGGSRYDEYFPPFPAPSQIVTLPGYWLVDLTVQRALTPSITLYFRGSNLLDEKYEQVFGYRAPGRAGYVGVRATMRR